jgi:hypothetical protein
MGSHGVILLNLNLQHKEKKRKWQKTDIVKSINAVMCYMVEFIGANRVTWKTKKKDVIPGVRFGSNVIL